MLGLVPEQALSDVVDLIADGRRRRCAAADRRARGGGQDLSGSCRRCSTGCASLPAAARRRAARLGRAAARPPRGSAPSGACAAPGRDGAHDRPAGRRHRASCARAPTRGCRSSSRCSRRHGPRRRARRPACSRRAARGRARGRRGAGRRAPSAAAAAAARACSSAARRPGLPRPRLGHSRGSARAAHHLGLRSRLRSPLPLRTRERQPATSMRCATAWPAVLEASRPRRRAWRSTRAPRRAHRTSALIVHVRGVDARRRAALRRAARPRRRRGVRRARRADVRRGRRCAARASRPTAPPSAEAEPVEPPVGGEALRRPPAQRVRRPRGTGLTMSFDPNQLMKQVAQMQAEMAKAQEALAAEQRRGNRRGRRRHRLGRPARATSSRSSSRPTSSTRPTSRCSRI